MTLQVQTPCTKDTVFVNKIKKIDKMLCNRLAYFRLREQESRFLKSPDQNPSFFLRNILSSHNIGFYKYFSTTASIISAVLFLFLSSRLFLRGTLLYPSPGVLSIHAYFDCYVTNYKR